MMGRCLPLNLNDFINIVSGRKMQISKELQQSPPNRMSAEEIDELCFADMSKATPIYLNGSAIKLMENLERLCKIVKGHESEFYLKARDLYCALNIELNQRYINKEEVAVAPAFREKLKRSISPDDVEAILSNDTQVIDFHLVWLKGATMHYRDGAEHLDNVYARKAVADGKFDFDEAYRFMASGGKIPEKLTYLDIFDEPELQWELVALKLSDVEDKRKEVHRKKVSARDKLYRAALRNQYVKGRESRWAEVTAAEDTINAMGKKRTPKLMIEILRVRSGLTGLAGNQIMSMLASARKYLCVKKTADEQLLDS